MRVYENAFSDSQFNCVPLIWIFTDKTIKSVKSTVENFRWFTLNTVNRRKNFFSLTTTFRFILSLYLFKFRTYVVFIKYEHFPYDLRNRTKVFLPPVWSSRGSISVHFWGSFLWNNLPASIKDIQTLNGFKQNFTVYDVCVVVSKYLTF